MGQVQLNKTVKINMLLFADDIMLIQECEDPLQKYNYEFHKAAG